MRKRPRLDANHTEIVTALRGAGCKVLSLAALGDGAPDLLVYSPFTWSLHLLEVKDGSKCASKQRLTDDEERFAVEWGIVKVVNSVTTAIAAVTVKWTHTEVTA